MQIRSRSARWALSWVSAAVLAACGGGQGDGPTALSAAAPEAGVAAAAAADAANRAATSAVAELARQALAAAAPRMHAQAVFQVVGAEERARRLMDFGEATFPQFFPHHAETGTWGSFRFRYYAESGVYLGVVTQPDPAWVEGGVYVMGGPFGGAPMYVGKATDFISVVPLGFEALPAADKLQITQGSSASLRVDLQRFNGLDRWIDLELVGLPEGVTAPPVSVPPNATQVEMALLASAGAPHSLPTTVRLRASVAGLGENGAALTEERNLNVTVRGLPGSVDTSFAGGAVLRPVGIGEDYANAVAVQADGRVLVAGSSATNTGTVISLVRHTRDGTPDASFGDQGRVLTAVGARSDVATAMTLQSDGKIIVVGHSDRGNGDSDFVVLRYLPDGTLDAGFAQGGKLLLSFGAGGDRAFAVAIQDDGKIVVAGESLTDAATTGVDFALARLNPDGSLDTSFGQGGKVVTPLKSFAGRDTVYALALPIVQGEQRILAVGGEGDFLAARYTARGQLDAGFGSGGKVVGLFNSSIGAARAVALVPGGRAVLAGGIGNDFAVAQLSENGTLDPGFANTAGKLVLPIRTQNWDGATALARQADGRLLLAGWAYSGNSSSADFVAVRLSAGGVLDDFFANQGVLIQPVAQGTRNDAARAMALQVDERVSTVRAILAGEASGPSNHEFALLRLWL